MNKLLAIALILVSTSALANRGVATNPHVTTLDKRVVYGEQSKEFYQVKKQRVCKTDRKGKQTCFTRGVSQHIPTR